MTEEPFKNREIVEMFGEVKTGLSKIEVQTTMHNGRMSKMEKWQAYMTGAFSVLTIVVVPLLSWALWVLANIQGQVHGAVDQALSAYNITAH